MSRTSKLPNVGTTIFSVMSKLANEHKAINLSQGFPNFDCDQRLQAFVTEYMQKGYNQYAPMIGVPVLRERLASKMQNLYHAPIHPEEEITITMGATQAIFTIITAFIKQGDEVIILEPCYDSYVPAIEVNGGIAVPYTLQAPNYRVDWAAIEQLISPRTRMIIINTPHNPTGTTLENSDLLTLQKLTQDTDILVLSDEVYEHLVYDGHPHESVLCYPDLYQRSLATFSFGKTFHATGWRIGYCVAPPHLMKEFRKVHQFNVFSINTPMQYAIAAYMEDPETYLSLGTFFQQKRDLFAEIMNHSRFRAIPCTGTYFQLFNYSAISDESDMAFAKRLTKEHGVATIPVSVFYSNLRDDKVVRFCFAKTTETLEKAGELLRKV